MCIVKVSFVIVVEDIVGFLHIFKSERSFFPFIFGNFVRMVGQSRLLS